MSTQIAETTGSPPPTAAARPRRRRVASSPLSLLATGEPMLWLTGGALVLCLVMIIGLLALVVYFGIGTFWPSTLVRLERIDGRAFLGEVTRAEDFQLGRQVAATMSGPLGERARELLGDREEVTDHRRLLRTGNFDLTQTHFHWVSDYEIAPRGESRPEWALTIERIEYGRFYGEPVRLAVRSLPTPELNLEEQARLLDFLQAGIYRVPREQREPLQARLEELVEPLAEARDALAARRREAAEKLLAAVADEGGADAVLVVNDSGETVPAEQWKAEQGLREALRTWSAPEQVLARFGELHPEVRERFYRRHRLEKFEIGRWNEHKEATRLRVRRAELRHDYLVLDGPVLRIRQIRAEIEALEREAEEFAHLPEVAAAHFGEGSPLTAAVRELAAAVTAEIRAKLAEPQARLAERERELAEAPEELRAAVARLFEVEEEVEREQERIQAEIDELKRLNEQYVLRMRSADGVEVDLPLGGIVRAYPANRLSLGEKFAVYFSRWREFLFDDPREANSEGGVFPAIIGTVSMTLIMSLAVVPFGVLAALYLREYAKAGLIVSAVRISINNLAGVPSIVFGVFGLGFFCYTIGAWVDGGAAKAGLPILPPAWWFLTLAGLAVTAVAAFFTGYLGTTARTQHPTRWQNAMRYGAVVLWITCTALLVGLVFCSPFFEGLYPARTADNNPTFGKGALLWASITLALLTLPVVIVATEEALAAVPNSMREGSYGCGASKWQTIRRIVLPHAAPGIMTGMILAMARGAGEVAPLMLVGAVKLALELPVDLSFPFLHWERSFMHLGFHIYDLGFQSQNSEAAKPMVFTTTLLLIGLIALLNLFAIWLRARLRRQFASSAF